MTINNDNFVKDITPIAESQTTIDIQQYIQYREPIFVEIERKEPPEYELVDYHFTQEEIDNIEDFIAIKSSMLWTIAAFLHPIIGGIYLISSGINGDRYRAKRNCVKKTNKHFKHIR